MATAEELLSAISEESAALVVDLNTRVISIPASISVLGVESDDDTRRLRFEVPQFYQGLDLSEFKIQVNFTNARAKGDFYPIKDVMIANDVLSFIWEVDRSAYAYKGDVEFNLCMKKYAEDGSIERELNTTTTTLPVLKGLETSKEVVENNPSAFDAVLFRLYAVESAAGLGQNGYYSIVKVTESLDGTLFTIMNKDGTTAALVKHGKDGITPVNGVDYFTEDEKTAFQSDIETTMKAYVDNWAPHYVTVTLTSTGWVDNKQTIAVSGVAENSPVFVAPVQTDENYEVYNDAEIRCIAQSVGSLTFQCGSTPSSDIEVNAAIYYSYGAATGTNRVGVLVSSAGTVLGTVKERTYTKIYDGDALYAFLYNGTYTGPLVVSTDPNAVRYNATGVEGEIGKEGFIEYNGKTYYYTGGAWMSGDYTSTVSPTIPGVKSNEEAALILAQSYEKYLGELTGNFTVVDDGNGNVTIL